MQRKAFNNTSGMMHAQFNSNIESLHKIIVQHVGCAMLQNTIARIRNMGFRSVFIVYVIVVLWARVIHIMGACDTTDMYHAG